MQPQIITNKLGQAGPISIYKSSPDSRARWVGAEAGCQPPPGGQRGLISVNTPITSSNRSHRDKVSFHIRKQNKTQPHTLKKKKKATKKWDKFSSLTSEPSNRTPSSHPSAAGAGHVWVSPLGSSHSSLGPGSIKVGKGHLGEPGDPSAQFPEMLCTCRSLLIRALPPGRMQKAAQIINNKSHT